jgi:hypothetical protein
MRFLQGITKQNVYLRHKHVVADWSRVIDGNERVKGCAWDSVLGGCQQARQFAAVANYNLRMTKDE